VRKRPQSFRVGKKSRVGAYKLMALLVVSAHIRLSSGVSSYETQLK